MKISAKLKVLAAAVGLLAAGGASAATSSFLPGTGNGSVILTVWDSTKSYMSGVGTLRLDSLAAGTYSFAGLSTLFSTFDPTTTYWSVTAFDTTTTTGSDQVFGTRILTTSNGTPSLGSATGTFVPAAGENFRAFDVNGCGSVSAGTACTATSASAPEYAGGASWGADFGSTGILSGTFLSTATTMAFYNIVPNGPDDFTAGFINNPVANLTNFTASLNLAAGTLTIANTSAVPVPAAVWLLGSALGGMGFFRRRRQA